jgi:hypothetical protein
MSHENSSEAGVGKDQAPGQSFDKARFDRERELSKVNWFRGDLKKMPAFAEALKEAGLTDRHDATGAANECVLMVMERGDDVDVASLKEGDIATAVQKWKETSAAKEFSEIESDWIDRGLR